MVAAQSDRSRRFREGPVTGVHKVPSTGSEYNWPLNNRWALLGDSSLGGALSCTVPAQLAVPGEDITSNSRYDKPLAKTRRLEHRIQVRGFHNCYIAHLGGDLLAFPRMTLYAKECPSGLNTVQQLVGLR